jgi:protein-tyrosine-phosphatase
MAEALLEEQLEQEGQAEGWRVESAGTWAQTGLPAMAPARAVMEEFGLDLSKHRSREVSAALMAQADLILTMEDGQREALQVEFPEHAARVRLLSSLAGPDFDVSDPFGQGIDAYRKTRDGLQQLIRRNLNAITTLVDPSAREGEDTGEDHDEPIS